MKANFTSQYIILEPSRGRINYRRITYNLEDRIWKIEKVPTQVIEKQDCIHGDVINVILLFLIIKNLRATRSNTIHINYFY